MNTIKTYIIIVLSFIGYITYSQTPSTVVKDGDYIVTGAESLTATQSIILKPNTWIKPGSTFSAAILESIPAIFSTDKNYVHQILYQNPLSENQLVNATDLDKIENITYYDGFGRPVQAIGIKQSPDKKDIITHIEYDGYGNQEKQYLPYASSDNLGQFRSNALGATNSYYNTEKYDYTLNPYSQSVYDSSPLKRVFEQAAPGASWIFDDTKVTNAPVTFEKDEVYEDYSFTGSLADIMETVTPGGGSIKIDIVNEIFTLSIDGSWSATKLKTNVPIYTLELTPNTPFELELGQLTDHSGNYLPYTAKISNSGSSSYLEFRAIGSPVAISGIKSSLSATMPGAGTTTYTYDKRESSNHTVKMAYETNIDPTGVVAKFGVDYNDGTPSLVSLGNYKESQLHKSITYDENWQPEDGKNRSTEEYTDKLGRVILKRTFAPTSSSTSEAYDTYYVYDDFGNLIYVIPPKVDISDGISSNELNELYYQYIYDSRNRIIEKKIPGKGWEYVVYNELDQPIMTQDALLKEQNIWFFTKYDVFGRVTYTGKINDERERADIQTEVNNETSTVWVNRGNAVSIGGVTMYYNNAGYPNAQNAEVLTVSYYDDYNLPTIVNLNPGTTQITWQDMIATDKVKGLATVTQEKVLETSDWITTTTYYDDKGRPWDIHETNTFLNSEDHVSTQLDFTGRILASKYEHTKNGTTTMVTDNFDYDHAGRLVLQTQQINNQESELIAEHTYDDLGRLENKKVGNTISNPLQQIDYDYNVRGWLTAINDVENIGDDLFTFKINYNTVEGLYNVPELYNGNISQTIWRTANDNTKRSYSYEYDVLSRVTRANSLKGNTLMTEDSFSIWGIAYDKNGNIGRITRNGRSDGATQKIDELYYTYEYNQLLKVREAVTSSHKNEGFIDGSNADDDFVYDINGNMIKDRNKGISTITYNYLNLPNSVAIANTEGTGNISYIYTASGVKLRKIATDGSSSITTEYAGNFVYENNSLQFFNHAEGYVEPEDNGSFTYIFQYKDHLDNIRLSYADNDGDGMIDIERDDTDIDGDGDLAHEIREEKNYYPFGLQHKGYNDLIRGRAHNYGFNGAEIDKNLGFNLYSMDLRRYDPTYARWTSIDPVTHHSMSTYNAFDNNPIVFADPSGGDAVTYTGGAAQEAFKEFRASYNDSNTYEQYFGSKIKEYDNMLGENECCGGMFRYLPTSNFPGSVNGYRSTRIAFFKSFFPEGGTANNLIDHYINGEGLGYVLNQKQMLEIYPIADNDGNLMDFGLSNFEMMSIGELSPGQSKPFKDEIQVYAGSPGTLGNFTLTRQGFITLNEQTGKREFTGSFIFQDTFDFNASDHRPWDAELQVTLARWFLPGSPFKIYGKMPVHQIQGNRVMTKYNGFNVSPWLYKKPGSTFERKEVSKF